MKKLKEAIFILWDNFLSDIAENIEANNWVRLVRKILTAVAIALGLLGVFALLLALLYATRSVLLPIIGGPALVALMIASYRANHNYTPQIIEPPQSQAMLEERAEALYPWVRDGIFLVLRSLSEYTSIIRPASPSAIETQARFYTKDKFAVFQFTALCSDTLDLSDFKRDFERVLGQMLRAGELPGLPSKLVTINGGNYLPVQVYTLSDMGSSINLDIVFADEHSLQYIEARRHLHLQRKHKTSRETPYDSEF